MLSVWAAVANPLERVSQTHPEVVALGHNKVVSLFSERASTKGPYSRSSSSPYIIKEHKTFFLT